MTQHTNGYLLISLISRLTVECIDCSIQCWTYLELKTCCVRPLQLTIVEILESWCISAKLSSVDSEMKICLFIVKILVTQGEVNVRVGTILDHLPKCVRFFVNVSREDSTPHNVLLYVANCFACPVHCNKRKR